MTTTALRSAVNPALTAKRRNRPVVENDSYARFARRIIAAYGRRVGNHGDIEALTDLVRLSDEVDHAIGQAVTALRGYGYSWADIAARLGVTRQAAQQRWGGTG